MSYLCMSHLALPLTYKYLVYFGFHSYFWGGLNFFHFAVIITEAFSLFGLHDW